MKTAIRNAKKAVKTTQKVLDFCLNPLCLHSQKTSGCRCCKSHT